MYDDTIINFYALLLGRAGLCPLKDDFPSQKVLLDLLQQADPAEHEQMKETLLQCLKKIRFG
jgi:hypothetical protein